jgi:hypothetical protein
METGLHNDVGSSKSFQKCISSRFVATQVAQIKKKIALKLQCSKFAAAWKFVNNSNSLSFKMEQRKLIIIVNFYTVRAA